MDLLTFKTSTNILLCYNIQSDINVRKYACINAASPSDYSVNCIKLVDSLVWGPRQWRHTVRWGARKSYMLVLLRDGCT